jgi:DedD protein
VQVASLSSAENASRLMAQLQKKGFPALLDTVESDVGRLNRVRVGPFAKETDAVAASALINREFEGVSPRVLDLKPDQSAAVTNPADPLVRWVVQMGSFSDSGNAQKLVEQLRRDGMTAYREDITTKSPTIYRVRVGPFLEREEAIRTRQQLSDRLKIDGVVMSAD